MPEARSLSNARFDQVYEEVILGNAFLEEPEYYVRDRPRYRRTLQQLVRLPLPRPAKVLEVGGGQVALLLNRLYGDACTLADIGDRYAEAVTRHGIEFVTCDLMHDDLPNRDDFDLVVLLEVIEHLPIPAHVTFEKIAAWLRPGGHIFLTTPNLYRLRNSLRLFLGMPVFYRFFYPQRGESLGHPLEYSAEHLRWQLERAGLEVEYVHERQLQNAGSRLLTRLGRAALRPMQLRPMWRDYLVASARKPER